MSTVTVNFEIDEADWRELQLFGERTGVDLPGLVTDAIREYLDKRGMTHPPRNEAVEDPSLSRNSSTALAIDHERGRKLAAMLQAAFVTTGIHGQVTMPEDSPPQGVREGSLEHILFITLTVSIDYQRDANVLWAIARRSYEDPVTRYLFDPKSLYERKPEQIQADMAKYGLSRKPKKDAWIWRTVGVSFLKKWGRDPRHFLDDCGWDAPTVLARLKQDRHSQGSRLVYDYPYLRGDKIGPLWLRMLRDNVGLSRLKNLESVPIPVDVHVARATFATGVVRGQYSGKVADAFEVVREAWFKSVRGLSLGSRQMMALDIDEALWNLSKYGCTKRNPDSGICPMLSTCEAGAFCVAGKLKVNAGTIEADT